MHKFVGTFVLLLLISHGSYCQRLSNNDIAKSSSQPAISERAENLANKAWTIRKSYPDSTIIYSKRAIDLFEQAGEVHKIAKLYNFMGVAYYYKGENILSHDNHVKAYNHAEQYHDSIQFGHALNNLGRVFMDQGDYVKAYDYEFRSLTTFEALHDDDGVAYALKRLGELYLSQREFQKALEVTERAMNIRIGEGDVGSQAYVHADFAKIYLDLGQFNNALNNYERAQLKATSVQDIVLIAEINLGIAQMFYSQERFGKALEHSLIANGESIKVKNIELSNRVLLILGKCYYQLGNVGQAQRMFGELEQGLVNANQLALEEQLYYYLSKIHYKLGEGKRAYELHEKYSLLKDSLNNTVARKEINRIEFESELNRRDAENQLLRAKQEKDQATIESQKTNNVALAVTIAAVILIAAIAVRSSMKRKKINDNLRAMNKSIVEQQALIERRNEQISQQNRELQLRNMELAELNNEKDTLMNIVAHDLKSPINRIKGMAQLLESTSLNKEQEEYVQMLSAITHANLDFIRDLLDVTAFESEGRKLNLTDVEMNELLRLRAKEFEAEAVAKRITLHNNGYGEEVSIRTDKELVSRIIDNLISNAIKFSDKNGRVEVSLKMNQGQALISVKDNGQGFTEEDKKNLYKKFTKLSAAPTGGENSNGLGLALSKILLDRLEGEIELISEPGIGSEFIVKLSHLT